MSRKRNDAARKQELKKREARQGSRRLSPGASPRGPTGGAADSASDPEVQRQTYSGGGVLMRMRGAVKRQVGGQAPEPARKRLSVLDLALWAAAIGAAAFLVVRYLGARG